MVTMASLQCAARQPYYKMTDGQLREAGLLLLLGSEGAALWEPSGRTLFECRYDTLFSKERMRLLFGKRESRMIPRLLKAASRKVTVTEQNTFNIKIDRNGNAIVRVQDTQGGL